MAEPFLRDVTGIDTADAARRLRFVASFDVKIEGANAARVRAHFERLQSLLNSAPRAVGLPRIVLAPASQRSLPDSVRVEFSTPATDRRRHTVGAAMAITVGAAQSASLGPHRSSRVLPGTASLILLELRSIAILIPDQPAVNWLLHLIGQAASRDAHPPSSVPPLPPVPLPPIGPITFSPADRPM